MSWNLIAKTAFASASNPGTSSAINTVGSDLIVAVYGGPGTVSLTDSASNSWTQAVSLTPNQTGAIYFKSAPVTSSSHTFQFANSNFSAAIIAVSGSLLGHGSPLDQTHAAAIASGNTAEQPGSITPTSGGQLLVFGNSLDSPSGNTFSVDSGFTIQESVDVNSGVTFGVVASTLFGAGTSAINPTMTRSLAITGGSQDVAFIASFFAATGQQLILQSALLIQ